MNPLLKAAPDISGAAQPDAFLDPRASLQSSRKVQGLWRHQKMPERLRIIEVFRHRLVESAADMAAQAAVRTSRSAAEILSSEILPLADACRFLERNASRLLANRKYGRRGRPFWLKGVRSVVSREPHGVVLIIAPSNYPFLLPGVQTLQALTAGNAVLLKPGPCGTFAAIWLSRLLLDAGLPSNLLKVLPESPAAAKAAIHEGVDKVVFTGSAGVGVEVLAQTAPRATPCAMELSGCDSVIVRPDADLDVAVKALRFGLTLNEGRTCIAPKRVFVARSIATEFEGRLEAELATGKTCCISPNKASQITPLVLQAIGTGAHVLAGAVLPGGELSLPLVLCGVSSNAPLLREDTFAPVMSVITVADDDEAVTLANNSPYGLGATIFSRDTVEARRLAERMDCGVVVINDMIVPTADARLPFGGRKLSGFGATRGAEGLLEFTTIKVVSLRRGASMPHLGRDPLDPALFESFLKVAHGQGVRNRFRALIDLIRVMIRISREKQ